jgi:hypothetical protein
MGARFSARESFMAIGKEKVKGIAEVLPYPQERTMTRKALFDTPKVAFQVLGLASAYATTLAGLERVCPSLKPDHIWAEVAGGVLITLVPVVVEARRAAAEQELDWETYERAVWTAFAASGIPIILWQIAEAIYRQREVTRIGATAGGTDVPGLLEQVQSSMARNPAFASLLVGVARDRFKTEY